MRSPAHSIAAATRFVVLALFPLSIATALAQTPAPTAPATANNPANQPLTLTTTTSLVRVPTMVRTKSGDPVFTLKASDFVVTDDGVPQTITVDEDTGSQPLALVVVVQTGGAGSRHLADTDRLPTFVDAIVGGVEHRVAVVTFDSEPFLLQPFTSNPDGIRESTHNFEAGDNGAAILDALQFSIDLLRSQPTQFRRAILLISETVDHGSKSTLEQSLRSTGDTNTTIYSVAFNSSRSQAGHEAKKMFGQIKVPGFVSAPAPPGPPNGCMGKETELTADSPPNRWVQAYDCLSLLAPPLRLLKIATLVAMNNLRQNVPETVARQTGGEYATFANAKGLERDLFAISNHLPNQYILSFHPQAPHPGLHTIGLALKNYDDLSVTARAIYWADTGAPRPQAP